MNNAMTDAVRDTGEDASIRWDPPGPGVWESDQHHQAEPFTALVADLWPDAASTGIATMMRRYGFPLETMQIEVVHGFVFMKPKMAGLPDRGTSTKPPPATVLRLVFRLVPELRRRSRRAAEALAGKLWLTDAATWRAERDDWSQRLSARQAVDLTSIDDAGLADELDACAGLLSALLQRHFEFSGAGLGLGALLLAAEQWGLDPEVVAGLLEGSSPSSQAARLRLRRVAGALDAADVDRARLRDLEPVAALGVIRSASSDADRLLDEYLAEYGWRATDNTGESPTLAERPDLLVKAFWAVADEPPAADVDARARVAEAEEALRQRVPASDRQRFDQLLAEARAVYETTDDNTGYVMWAAGLLRRAAIEAAGRLTDTGTLDDPDLMVHCTAAELAGALRGTSAGLASRARTRCVERRRLVTAGVRPPTHIGGQPPPPPDPASLPAALGQLFRTMDAYQRLRFPAAPETLAQRGRVLVDEHVVARGHAVGRGTYTGRACVASSPEDALMRLEPGDVLVCPLTVPSYDPLFAIAGAVVTEIGGPMGHSAVMAREFGLPAVIGTGPVTIADGRVVTVIAND